MKSRLLEERSCSLQLIPLAGNSTPLKIISKLWELVETKSEAKLFLIPFFWPPVHEDLGGCGILGHKEFVGSPRPLALAAPAAVNVFAFSTAITFKVRARLVDR